MKWRQRKNEFDYDDTIRTRFFAYENEICKAAAERRMIMKIRITIMTENNKHLDEKYSKELIEQKAKDGWDFALKALALLSEKNETASVESCELVER